MMRHLLILLAGMIVATVHAAASGDLTAYSVVTWDGRRLVSRAGTFELVPTNALPAHLPPVRRWTIYGIKSAHSDLGLHRSNYIQRRNAVRRVDLVKALIDADRRADSDPAAFRYVIEGWWGWLNYPEDRDAARADDFLSNYLPRGRVDIGGNWCGSLTHAMGYEELCRSLYAKRIMENVWGVHTRTAQMVDNPGITSALIPLYCEAGIEHLTFWPNPYPMGGHGNSFSFADGSPTRPTVFWWASADGAHRVLVWTGPSYVSGGNGFAPSTAYIDKPSHPFPHMAQLPPKNWKPDLTAWMQQCARRLAALEKKVPYDVWLYPDYHDDEVPSTRLADAYAAWNARFATPTFRTVGSLDEPFDRLKAKFADAIPTVRGDLTCSWTRGMPAAAELYAAKFAADRALPLREAASVIHAVETGAACPERDFAHAYEALILNDDHSFGFSGYTGRRCYDTWAQHADWIEFAQRVARPEIEPARASGIEGVAENRWYRIAVTNGVIHSLYDKELGRELIDAPANRLWYTRDRYKTGSDLATLGATNISQIVTLDPNEKAVLIENRIDHARDLFNHDRFKRFGHLVFPFAVPQARFVAQLNGPVVDARDGVAPAMANSYACVRDWCAAENGAFGVALVQRDTCVTEWGCLHGATPFARAANPTNGCICVSAFGDGMQWHLAEAPSFRFRFAITSYRGSWRDAHLPAFARRHTGETALKAQVDARIGTDAPNVELIALKVAERGGGLVVRLRETEGRATTTRLRQTLVPGARIERVTVLERPWEQAEGNVTADGRVVLRPFETVTLGLTGLPRPIVVAPPQEPWTGLATRLRVFAGGKPGLNYLLWGADEHAASYEIYRGESPDFPRDAAHRIGTARNVREHGILLRNAYFEDRVPHPGTRSWYDVRTLPSDSVGCP